MEFMQSHLLLLPQTFSDLPSSKLVTCKEMTSSTDFLEDFSVSDWTTLDFASVSHPVFCDLQFKGSRFQQLINTRHLPLIFSYSSSFVSQPPARSEPKLDFSQSSAFYESVESSLLASTNNSVCSLTHTSSFLVSYTDGSCPNNRTVGPDNPAGWGFALYVTDSYPKSHSAVNDSWICSYGQVKNSPIDANVINPVDGSNNTGEMRAIVELFDYFLFTLIYRTVPPLSSILTLLASFVLYEEINSLPLITDYLSLLNSVTQPSVQFTMLTSSKYPLMLVSLEMNSPTR